MIDGEGLHPTQDKLKAIRDAPRPKDVTALKSFLGLIMFYSWFMTHHSTVQAPLHQLVKKGIISRNLTVTSRQNPFVCLVEEPGAVRVVL